MGGNNKDFSRLRALVVEDSQAMRSMEASMLKELGLTQIDQVSDGSGAMELLQQHRYDLIVCDWEMPRVSGYEVLVAIKKNKDSATIPFLMVTAQSKADKVKKAIAAGVDDYLLKPFQQENFNDKVLRLLARGLVANGV